MSDEMVDYFRDLYQEIDFPVEAAITPPAKNIFYQAMDVCLMYRGHPDVLFQGLKGFLHTGSRPLAYAGAAKILMHAAYLSDDEYDADGLKLSREWLAYARRDARNCFEIELVQVEIDLASNDLAKIRATLNHLNKFGQAKRSYYVAIATMIYLSQAARREQRQKWERVAEKRAQNDYQKIFVINRIAKNYMHEENWKDSIPYFERVVALNQKDPWAWHNMSICYFATNDIENAERCNDMALSLMDFGAAKRVRQGIQQYKNGGPLIRLRTRILWWISGVLMATSRFFARLSE